MERSWVKEAVAAKTAVAAAGGEMVGKPGIERGNGKRLSVVSKHTLADNQRSRPG